MTGRRLTAWFRAPDALIDACVPRAIQPPGEDRTRIRLRFYDLRYEALGGSAPGAVVPREGRIREGVVAFPARAGGLEGDATLFMWADSDAYMAWGREVYGWPVVRGDIELEGTLWGPGPLQGSRGAAGARTEHGTARLEDVVVGGEVTPAAGRACWMAPRRRLELGGSGGAIDDVTAALPRVEAPGRAYDARCRIAFDFPAPHPLSILGEAEPESVEFVDGLIVVVGEDVEVVEVAAS